MARILSRADVQQCLTMMEAIAAMRDAFAALSMDQAQLPQRLAIDLPQQSVALLMPSLVQMSQQKAFGLKMITVMPNNPLRHLPLTYASVLLLDVDTGKTLAVMEGGWLTAMRTGAACGLATDILALHQEYVLAVFGAGAQALMQVLALHTVRPLKEIRVVNRNEEHYQHFVEEVHTLLRPSCPPMRHALSAEEALDGAMLVTCATTATTPLFSSSMIASGTHINAIGAFTPAMCEVGADTLAKASIFVDQREAARTEAGDLLQAFAQGQIAGPETWTELGEVVVGIRPGRQYAQEITCFKSVGVAVQDVVIAAHVYERACALGIGVEVDV